MATSRSLPSETEQVAALDVNQLHMKLTEVVFGGDNDIGVLVEDRIANIKRSMSSAATRTISRVKERHPERNYAIQSTVFTTAANRLYVGVLIERDSDTRTARSLKDIGKKAKTRKAKRQHDNQSPFNIAP